MTPLCLIAKKYGCDKFRSHRYTPIYYRLLGGRAETIASVLEVGIGKGRSLRMWEEFFPKARIVGVDIDPELLINEGRIASYVGDQASSHAMTSIAGEHGPFDLIIDDGDHAAERQVAAMQALLPFLAAGGLYFIEDIRYVVDDIVTKIPVGYRWEAYEGEKRLVAGLRKGRSEVLMMIQSCST